MSSMSVTSPTTPVPMVSAAAPATARAADGDYKAAGTGQMKKDSDGDYKSGTAVSAAPVTVAATSSSAVQSALANLQKGG